MRALPDEFEVRPQTPLTLGELSEPEPDIAVVRTTDTRGASGHPTHALLVVEVAGESLRKDRVLKASLYARFAVPEHWLVDLDGRAVTVHRGSLTGWVATARPRPSPRVRS